MVLHPERSGADRSGRHYRNTAPSCSQRRVATRILNERPWGATDPVTRFIELRLSPLPLRVKLADVWSSRFLGLHFRRAILPRGNLSSTFATCTCYRIRDGLATLFCQTRIIAGKLLLGEVYRFIFL